MAAAKRLLEEDWQSSDESDIEIDQREFIRDNVGEIDVRLDEVWEELRRLNEEDDDDDDGPPPLIRQGQYQPPVLPPDELVVDQVGIDIAVKFITKH